MLRIYDQVLEPVATITRQSQHRIRQKATGGHLSIIFSYKMEMIKNLQLTL